MDLAMCGIIAELLLLFVTHRTLSAVLYYDIKRPREYMALSYPEVIILTVAESYYLDVLLQH